MSDRDYWRAPFQRAKVVKTNDYRNLIGRELWVRVGPPVRRKVSDVERKRPAARSLCYTTNLFDDRGVPLLIGADQVELLARDASDFSECVEVEYWKTWRDRE